MSIAFIFIHLITHIYLYFRNDWLSQQNNIRFPQKQHLSLNETIERVMEDLRLTTAELWKTFNFTFSSLTLIGLDSECKVIWISWTFSSPTGRGRVTSSAISRAASSNYDVKNNRYNMLRENKPRCIVQKIHSFKLVYFPEDIFKFQLK